MKKLGVEKPTSFFLKARHLDIQTGHSWIVVLHEDNAREYGVRAGDEVTLRWRHKETEVKVDLTKNLVKRGEIGLFQDIIKKYQITEGESLEISLAPPPSSLEAIKKKLLGEQLTSEEYHSIIADIVHYRLDDVQIAYFLASAFSKKGFSKEEIYYLTKAMAETGEMLEWSPNEIIADKHSIGGVPGNRTTPIVVSIIASLGIKIPKTSSRAVTSEAGTADVLEVLTPVEFSLEEIRQIVEKTNGCMVWGGALKLAPADDRILRVSYELGIEPYSKMIVSIMAKKIAIGANRLVIDMPIGEGTKVQSIAEARKIRDIFLYLSRKFKIKTKVLIEQVGGPIGRGIGPILEIRDVLRVLQQKDNRPIDLERRAVKLAGILLELTGKARFVSGERLAKKQLVSGAAEKKFREIITTQGGKVPSDSEQLTLGAVKHDLVSPYSGRVKRINSGELIRIARLLGSPYTKEAGIYLHKKRGERVEKGEIIATLYTNSQQRLGLAVDELKGKDLFYIK